MCRVRRRFCSYRKAVPPKKRQVVHMKITVRIAGNWVYRMRRVLATLCIAALAVFLGYRVVFGANGMKVWESKRAQVERLESEIERKKIEHDQLQHHVDGCNKAFPASSRRKRASNWAM